MSGACANGVDDDDNGLIDFPYDPGCAAQGDPDESELAELAVCANGIDDDLDGLIDYPLDPGCSGRGSASEVEPTQPPACANGIDDDQDGAIDFPDDSGCASASYFSEVNSCLQINGAIPLSTNNSGETRVPVSTVSRSSTVVTGCQAVDRPESKFLYRVPPGVRRLSAWVYIEPTAPNAVSLAAYRDCQPTELGCRQGGDASYVYLEVNRPEAGLIVFAVEGAPPGSHFRLSQTMASACSNGLDDDDDGLVDATDPGCISAGHHSEDDPDRMPACANGNDDDADGQIDYPSDPACDRAAGASEANRCAGHLSTVASSAVYGLAVCRRALGSAHAKIADWSGAGLLNLRSQAWLSHLVRDADLRRATPL